MPGEGPESKLMQALAALAEQVWVLKDRQVVTEQVLAAKGIDLHDEIEHFQPDAELAARLDEQRQHFIATVMASFRDDPAGDG